MTTTWNDLADKMLADGGPAALVCRQWLIPAEGRDAVIFPPTFAAPEGGGRAGYNIDEIHDSDNPNKVTRIAIIDTVGSQANRMEPLFRATNGEDTRYSRLVPQIEIKAGTKVVNLLDAGHRAADAIVRFSGLGPTLSEAFDIYQQTGDATRLAKIAPTSLVFGAWDSRGTQAKLPRLVASTIRAYDVVELRRSAQYNPPIDYIALGLIENPNDKKVLDAASELGFRHAPAGGTHGGIIVRGEIRREAILSLVGLRAVGPKGSSGNALRRYLLGLALLALMHEREHNLRQGCLLVQDPEKKPLWELVMHDGVRTSISPDVAAASAFAEQAAAAFGVGEDRTVAFDAKAANKALKEQVADDRGKKVV
jgi:CRISPR-associated protein Csb1